MRHQLKRYKSYIDRFENIRYLATVDEAFYIKNYIKFFRKGDEVFFPEPRFENHCNTELFERMRKMGILQDLDAFTTSAQEEQKNPQEMIEGAGNDDGIDASLTKIFGRISAAHPDMRDMLDIVALSFKLQALKNKELTKQIAELRAKI